MFKLPQSFTNAHAVYLLKCICSLLGVDPRLATSRQVSKFRNGRGAIYNAMVNR